MIIKKAYLQKLVNEEFSKAIRARKKRLAEARVADDLDVGGDMAGRCLDCGHEEEECMCDPEMMGDDAPGDWRGHCPKCGADEMDCPGHGLGESKKRSKRVLAEMPNVRTAPSAEVGDIGSYEAEQIVEKLRDAALSISDAQSLLAGGVLPELETMLSELESELERVRDFAQMELLGAEDESDPRF